MSFFLPGYYAFALFFLYFVVDVQPCFFFLSLVRRGSYKTLHAQPLARAVRGQRYPHPKISIPEQRESRPSVYVIMTRVFLCKPYLSSSVVIGIDGGQLLPLYSMEVSYVSLLGQRLVELGCYQDGGCYGDFGREFFSDLLRCLSCR